MLGYSSTDGGVTRNGDDRMTQENRCGRLAIQLDNSIRRGDLPEYTISAAEATCLEDQLAQIHMDALDLDLAGRNGTRIVGQNKSGSGCPQNRTSCDPAAHQARPLPI